MSFHDRWEEVAKELRKIHSDDEQIEARLPILKDYFYCGAVALAKEILNAPLADSMIVMAGIERELHKHKQQRYQPNEENN